MKRLLATLAAVVLLSICGLIYASESAIFKVDIDSPVEAFGRNVRVLAEISDGGELYDNMRNNRKTEALTKLQVFKEVLNAASGRRLVKLLDGVRHLTGFEVSEKMLIDLFGERAVIGLWDRGQNDSRPFLAVAKVGTLERMAVSLLEFRDSMADSDKHLIGGINYKGAKLETMTVDVSEDGDGTNLHYFFGGGYLFFSNYRNQLKNAVDTMLSGKGSSLATEKNYKRIAKGHGKAKRDIRIYFNGNLPELEESKLSDRIKHMLLKAAPGTMIRVGFEDSLTIDVNARLDGIAAGSIAQDGEKPVTARPPDYLLPERTVAVIDNLALSPKYMVDLFNNFWFLSGQEKTKFNEYRQSTKNNYDFDLDADLFGLARPGALLALADVDFVIKRGFLRQVLYLPFAREDEANEYAEKVFRYFTKRSPYQGSYRGVDYGAVENPEEEYDYWDGGSYKHYRLDVPAYCWLEGYLIVARDFLTLRTIIERARLGEMVRQLDADNKQLAGLVGELPANRLIDRVGKATGIKLPAVAAVIDGQALRGLIATYLFDLSRMQRKFIYEDAAVRLLPLAESLAFLGDAKMALKIEQGELEARLVWGEQ
jgi:Protein of unknown function (DUF3352)